MTAAGSQNPVLLQDKIFFHKYIPSQDFRHGHQSQTLHKVKSKPRIYDVIKNDAQLYFLFRWLVTLIYFDDETICSISL